MFVRDRIAVSIGDPNGVGPEIAVRAAAHFVGSALQPVLIGDTAVIAHYAARDASHLPLRLFVEDTPHDGIAYVAVDTLDPNQFRPGVVSASAGRATVEYVRIAVDLVQRGLLRAIVACPHSETSINSGSIAFSGYPSLIAQLTGTREDRVFLMLVAPEFRIAHVTLHESVRQALARIDSDLIVAAGLAAVRATEGLGIRNIRLGVCGINPHAGEAGLFGDEDDQITLPAVTRLRELGIDVTGPVGADLLFGQRRHDVYLAMFHDLGHIPVTLLSPLRASALTIGAPIQFSSVGHGSAFDIAGKGIADPVSVIETLQLLHGAAKER